MSLFEFHSSQFKKERSKLLKNLTSAYIQKHEIWGQSDDKDRENKPRKEESINWDDVKTILALADAMEDVSYHKQLE